MTRKTSAETVTGPRGRESGDSEKVLSTIVDRRAPPESELQLVQPKLGALIKLDQQDKALESPGQPEGEFGEDSEVLNAIAWSIVDPELGAKPQRQAPQTGPRRGQEARRESRSQERRDRAHAGQAILELGPRREGPRDLGAALSG